MTSTKPRPLFVQVKAALDSEDIEGLLALGCPADEYDSEARMIEGRIVKFGDEPPGSTQVERIIAEVWSEMFGPFGEQDLQKRHSAFVSVARNIIGP